MPDRSSTAYRRKAAALRRRGAEEGLPCWLCGEDINYALEWPHPMSFSADHVQALANGGALLGELQPAHLAHNSARGDGDFKGDRPKPGARRPIRTQTL